MDYLTSLEDLIYSLVFKKYFGLSFLEFIIIFSSLFLALVIRSFFSKLIVKKIRLIVEKTNNKIDDSIFESLIPPIKLVPLIFVLSLISMYFDITSVIGVYLIKINSTIFTIFIFWLIYTFLNPIKFIFTKYEDILSKALYRWMVKY